MCLRKIAYTEVFDVHLPPKCLLIDWFLSLELQSYVVGAVVILHPFELRKSAWLEQLWKHVEFSGDRLFGKLLLLLFTLFVSLEHPIVQGFQQILGALHNCPVVLGVELAQRVFL